MTCTVGAAVAHACTRWGSNLLPAAVSLAAASIIMLARVGWRRFVAG